MTNFLLLMCVLGLFVSAESFAGEAQFRGYSATENIIRSRLLDPSQRFNFTRYLDPQDQFGGMQLLLLLGGTDPFSQDPAFRNGTPNSVNMLLWRLLLDSLAKDFQKACTGDLDLLLNSGFRQAIMGMCRWPDPEAQSESAMLLFWLSTMGYDAPKEEFTAWRNFFLSSSYSGQRSAETLPAMMLSIFYNPHFLLRK